jgi:hypothetical protein
VAAKQLTELGGAAEWVRYQLAGRQRDRRLDAAISLSEQIGTGREETGVEFCEPLEPGKVILVCKAQGDGPLPGRGPVLILIPAGSTPRRHE